jgi:phosphatidylserine decarboxylase
MARYARTEIVLILLIGGTITVASAVLLHGWALVPGLLALALLTFYRDPPRQPTAGEDLLLAPADGKIVKIERDWRADGSRAAELRIVIFLSVLNVHINRSPCAGVVTDVAYHPGEFLNALRTAATTRNESNLVTIQPAPPLPGPVHVRQIAGVLARRLVCTLAPGDPVSAGERFGMIKLGSQTEIRAPADARWELRVRPGDAVRAGLTVLARLGSQPES